LKQGYHQVVLKMTDRFYPLGKHSAADVWKSSYEVQNEMRSFQRSAYPPGYAGHEPGARDKFGFSTPGPDAARLTKSSLALREDVDIAEPRRILAMPRMQVTDERETFRDLDRPEMDRSYRSAIVSPAFRSMAKTMSLPVLERKPAPPRLGQMPPAQAKIDDDHFTYFVPKALNREGTDRLMSRSLSKLYRHPEKKVMLPFAGDGTGFRTQCCNSEWWPPASRLHDEPSSYASHFKTPSFYRMSPLNVARTSSVRFDSLDGDGFGSIRLGTPTPEERAAHQKKARAHFGSEPLLNSDALERSTPFPVVKPTPAARFGYMPPGHGRITRTGSSQGERPVVEYQGLSDRLLAKLLKLYQAMDRNSNGSINREEAKLHFKRFAEVSANAMFNEVDEDRNDEISLEEFVDFWQQVKKSGYQEDDLSYELDELLKGNVWVDYADDRDVGKSADMRTA
jgi:hypothetical protein